MKVTIKIKKEGDIRYLKVDAGLRYWEDADVNGEPDIDLFESKGEQQGRCNKVVEWILTIVIIVALQMLILTAAELQIRQNGDALKLLIKMAWP